MVLIFFGLRHYLVAWVTRLPLCKILYTPLTTLLFSPCFQTYDQSDFFMMLPVHDFNTIYINNMPWQCSFNYFLLSERLLLAAYSSRYIVTYVLWLQRGRRDSQRRRSSSPSQRRVSLLLHVYFVYFVVINWKLSNAKSSFIINIVFR